MKGCIIFALVFILLISISGATHYVETSDGNNSISVEVDDAFYYNFSIKNLDLSNGSEIHQLNITLPNALQFRASTEITNAFFQTFSNTTNTLIWSNFAGSLIGLNETKYFSFVAESKDAGNYSISFRTFNSNSSYLSSIPVEISVLTSSCTENWNCTNWSMCIAGEQIRNCTDLNSCNTTDEKPAAMRTCTVPACTENWSCTNWSECVDKSQIRSCVDLNTCNNSIRKPSETQYCEVNEECTPAYSCTEWAPSKCDKNQIQTRVCTDENNCNKFKEKPSETRECKANSVLFYIILLIIVTSLIAFFTILLIIAIKKYKELNERKYPNKGNFQMKKDLKTNQFNPR